MEQMNVVVIPADGEAVDPAFDEIDHAAARGEADGLLERLVSPFIFAATIVPSRAPMSQRVMVAQERLIQRSWPRSRQVLALECQVIAVGRGVENLRGEIDVIERPAFDIRNRRSACRQVELFQLRQAVQNRELFFYARLISLKMLLVSLAPMVKPNQANMERVKNSDQD